MKLPASISLHQDETLLSFSSRLAAANGYPSLSGFLRFTDTDAKSIMCGEPKAIETLSALSGIESGKLASLTRMTTTKNLGFKLGEAVFSVRHRRANAHRFCIACVQEDIRNGSGRPVTFPYTRAWWETRAVLTCPIHGLQIMEVSCKTGHHDFGYFIERNPSLFSDANAATQVRITREIDHYLIGRIKGEKTYPFLDVLETYIVADFCKNFGRFLRRHRNIIPEEIQAKLGLQDDELGFQSVKLGQKHFSELVTTILRDKSLVHRDVRAPLYPISFWLRRNKDAPAYLNLVNIFQDLAERNIPLGPGQICILPTKKRYRHSVRTASIEYRLTRNRVVELLKNAKIISFDAPNRCKTTFDAELAKPILKAAQDTLNLTHAAAIIGLTGPRLHDIIEAGLLRRVEGNRGDRRTYTRIAKHDLIDFQNRLFQHAKPLCHSNDYLPILGAARRCKCQLFEIVDLVLSEQLEGIARKHRDMTFSNLYIDWEEVRAKQLRAMKEQIGSELLSIKEVSAELKTASWKVYPLVQSEILPSIEMFNPTTNRKQSFIKREALKKFRHIYISCSELASIHRTRADTIARQLDQLNIKPSFDLENPSKRFRLGCYYRRSDLKKVTLAHALS